MACETCDRSASGWHLATSFAKNGVMLLSSRGDTHTDGKNRGSPRSSHPGSRQLPPLTTGKMLLNARITAIFRENERSPHPRHPGDLFAYHPKTGG